MRTGRSHAWRHGVDDNFAGDNNDGTAYIAGVGVKSVDCGARAMTETLIGTIGAAFLGWVGASVAWAFSVNSRVSVVENQQVTLSKWLERVEQKLDHVIAERRR